MAAVKITDEEKARREHFWDEVEASYAALSPEELADGLDDYPYEFG